MDNFNEETLIVLREIAKALAQIAENTKPDDVEERDYRIKGFGAGEFK